MIMADQNLLSTIRCTTMVVCTALDQTLNGLGSEMVGKRHGHENCRGSGGEVRSCKNKVTSTPAELLPRTRETNFL